MYEGTITGFVGPKGSGKTFAGIAASKGERRLIRCDMNFQQGMAEGATVIDRPSELAEYWLDADKRKAHRVCFRGVPDHFEFANRVAMAIGGCAILWDEAESLMPKTAIPDHAAAIIRRSRHKKVNLYWTSQRPTNMHPDVRANSDRIYIFPGFDSTYHDWVKSVIGPEGLDMLKGLEKYQPLLIEAGKPPRPVKKF